MITSDRQDTAAKEKLAMLQASLKAPIKQGVPDTIAKATRGQLKEMINEIKGEIEEYKSICRTDPSKITINSVDDLMVIPIRYRLASRMSVDAFARKVEINARQIKRYEAENYQNSNISTLKKILGHLNLGLLLQKTNFLKSKEITEKQKQR